MRIAAIKRWSPPIARAITYGDGEGGSALNRVQIAVATGSSPSTRQSPKVSAGSTKSLPRVATPIGIRLSPLWAAVIGLGLNYAAYEAENYRAGIQSIPKGHMDAALALGLSRRQTIVKVVLPQAVRLVIPPVTNDFIALLKDSSLVSVITMVELTKVYGQLASTYYDYIGIGLVTATIYFVLGLPIARLSRTLESRLAYMKT